MINLSFNKIKQLQLFGYLKMMVDEWGPYELLS